jgi:hypothetical protein
MIRTLAVRLNLSAGLLVRGYQLNSKKFYNRIYGYSFPSKQKYFLLIENLFLYKEPPETGAFCFENFSIKKP